MKSLNVIHNSWLMRRCGVMVFTFLLAKGVLWVLAPFVFIWFT